MKWRCLINTHCDDWVLLFHKLSFEPLLNFFWKLYYIIKEKKSCTFRWKLPRNSWIMDRMEEICYIKKCMCRDESLNFAALICTRNELVLYTWNYPLTWSDVVKSKIYSWHSIIQWRRNKLWVGFEPLRWDNFGNSVIKNSFCSKFTFRESTIKLNIGITRKLANGAIVF